MKLLPCPFCGCKAKIKYDRVQWSMGGPMRYWVACEARRCKINPYALYDFETKEEAIEAWNKRK